MIFPLNLQVIRYGRQFFEYLKIIRIHLAEHTAFDLLRNLDPIVCKQITELWLNTKNVARDDEPIHENDMTSILTKFGNLESLHLSTSLIAIVNLNHLFSVFQKLKKVSRIDTETDHFY